MLHQESYISHLKHLIDDLENARKEVKEYKGVHKLKALGAVALASDKVGNQLRQWDKKFAQEGETLSDVDRLADIRAWLFTLPAYNRKKFYMDCSIDEAAQSGGIKVYIDG